MAENINKNNLYSNDQILKFMEKTWPRLIKKDFNTAFPVFAF